MSFLSLKGVSKRYGTVTALDGFALDVVAGSRTVVVGASGSGKTTLLRLIAGFEMPDRGTIVLDGQRLADGGAGMPVHLRGIAFVAQDGALFPHMSVADNIGFAIDRSDGDRAQRIAELMDLVELPKSTAARAPHQLSGGQQQRVAIARGLARKPKLMLLDEPFSALDAGLRESVRQAAARVMRAAGVTTILVTHDQTEALSFADQLAVLTEGRLAQAGPPREVYLRPRDPKTAAFLGDAIVVRAAIAGGMAACAFGRIPVAPGPASDAGLVMLRPEQLKLAPAGAGASAGIAGRIVDVVFGGSMSMVVVAVTGMDGSGERTVTMRVASTEAMPVGSPATVTVSGTAHVFPAGAAAGTAGHGHL